MTTEAFTEVLIALEMFDAGMPIGQPYKEQVQSATRALNLAMTAMSDQVQDHAEALARIKEAYGRLTGVFGALTAFYAQDESVRSGGGTSQSGVR